MNATAVFADARTREFGGAAGHIYLNAAGYGPLPERSRRALASFDERRWQAALTDADLVAPLEAARAAVALLIGAESAEIVLTPNTNSGVNIAATAALRLADRRGVVLLHDREFPANVYPWLALRQHGFEVEFVAGDPRGLPAEENLLKRIAHGDVAVVSVSFVQFATGFRANLDALRDACHRHGTLFVIDAIQGVGVVPFDVRACGADIVACGGQKWLCAPWGSGFAYVRRDLIERFDPLLPGWLAFEATQDFNQLIHYRYAFLTDSRRFEVGTLGFQDYLGLQHSIELLLELGITNIWQHACALQQPIIEWAQSRGVEIVSDLRPERRSGILSIRPRAAAALFAALEQNGVRCALRENSIRISPHWYNHADDIERVVHVLDTNLAT